MPNDDNLNSYNANDGISNGKDDKPFTNRQLDKKHSDLEVKTRDLINQIRATPDPEMLWREFVTEWQLRFLFFAARMLGNWAVAEEACQDIFSRLYEDDFCKFDSSKGSVVGWFFMIAKQICLENLRKKEPVHFPRKEFYKKEEKEKLEFVETDSSEVNESRCRGISPEEEAIRKDQLDKIEIEIEKGKSRGEVNMITLSLYLVDGLTYEEIAERLGISIGTVKSRISNGYEDLRERLNGEGRSP